MWSAYCPARRLSCRPAVDAHSMCSEDASCPADANSCQFCPRAGSCHVMVTADEDGVVKLWDSRRRPTDGHPLMLEKKAHTNAIYDLDFSSDGRHLLSSAGDRFVRMWDFETMSLLSEFCRQSRTFKTVSFMPQDTNVFASGGRDGVVEVWDVRVANNICHEIHPAQYSSKGKSRSSESTALSSVTSLVFRDHNYLITAGSGSGTVSVWDLRRQYSVRQRCAHTPCVTWDWSRPEHGVVAMTLDRWHGYLYVSRIHDVIQRYNVLAWQPDIGYRYGGHSAGSYFVRCCVSPDGQSLVSGSSDSAAALWSVVRPGRPVCQLTGHSREVTAVAWSPAGDTLATVSDDVTFRLWRTYQLPPIDADDVNPQPMTSPHLPALPVLIGRRQTGGGAWLTHAQTMTDAQLNGGAPRVRTPRKRKAGARRSLASTPSGSPGFLRSWLRQLSPGAAAVRRSPRKTPVGTSAVDMITPTKRSREEDGEDDRTPTSRRTPRKDIPSEDCVEQAAASSTSATPRRSPRKLFGPSDAGRNSACSSSAQSGCHTPTKSPASSPRRLSPRKSLTSPTAGLPNWVMDRVSPHRPQLSPGRRPRSVHADWLTRLTQRKRAQRRQSVSADENKS